MTHPSTVADTLDAGDGWIAWAGGECPVDATAKVSVMFRDGGGSSAYSAGDWNWTHAPSPRRVDPESDIIAYRMVQP